MREPRAGALAIAALLAGNRGPCAGTGDRQRSAKDPAGDVELVSVLSGRYPQGEGARAARPIAWRPVRVQALLPIARWTAWPAIPAPAAPSQRTPSQQEVARMVEEEAIRQGVDPNFALAIAEQESRFRQSARSAVGATGVMQLMPGTAAQLGVNPLRYTRQHPWWRQIHQATPGDVRRPL
ncbi:transglycosylase SLT domain-containing protein [Rhizobium beringeri]